MVRWKQSRHIRKSKRGKRFVAGSGLRKKRSLRIDDFGFSKMHVDVVKQRIQDEYPFMQESNPDTFKEKVESILARDRKNKMDAESYVKGVTEAGLVPIKPRRSTEEVWEEDFLKGKTKSVSVPSEWVDLIDSLETYNRRGRKSAGLTKAQQKEIDKQLDIFEEAQRQERLMKKEPAKWLVPNISEED